MIDIAYMILFACIAVIGILTITRKMSLGIGLAGIGTGLAVAWILAPYLNIVMLPVGAFIWYGGVLSLGAILGIVHLASLVLACAVAGYNLIASGGKIVWA